MEEGVPAVSAEEVTTNVPTIYEMRETLTKTLVHVGVLTSMLDELAQLRAKDRLRTDMLPAADTDDLPPDAATGLYLDRPFGADDLVWLQNALGLRDGVGGFPRYGQLMLVFAAIQRDERATHEFLRVMNTIVLPLLRRLRLKDQPDLVRFGVVNE